jgi:putative acetyltransferase
MVEAKPNPGDCGFSFRDILPAETEAVLDLWVAAWNAALPAIDFAARRAWFRERLSLLRKENFVLRGAIEEASCAIIGFIAISPQLRYLDHIAAHPKHWGTGLGEALIAEAKRLSPEGVALDVNQQNPRAVAFYEKHGFRRLRADRNPVSGLPTWWYAWGEAEPSPLLAKVSARLLRRSF